MINEMERGSNGHSANLMFAFLTGASLGAAAGLLLAPKTGRESRDRLRGYFQKTGEKLRDLSRQTGFARPVAQKTEETVSKRG